jgi:hypothetical protein
MNCIGSKVGKTSIPVDGGFEENIGKIELRDDELLSPMDDLSCISLISHQQTLPRSLVVPGKRLIVIFIVPTANNTRTLSVPNVPTSRPLVPRFLANPTCPSEEWRYFCSIVPRLFKRREPYVLVSPQISMSHGLPGPTSLHLRLAFTTSYWPFTHLQTCLHLQHSLDASPCLTLTHPLRTSTSHRPHLIRLSHSRSTHLRLELDCLKTTSILAPSISSSQLRTSFTWPIRPTVVEGSCEL